MAASAKVPTDMDVFINYSILALFLKNLLLFWNKLVYPKHGRILVLIRSQHTYMSLFKRIYKYEYDDVFVILTLKYDYKKYIKYAFPKYVIFENTSTFL